MLSLNIHDVHTIDLGRVQSYFCRDSNRLFYAREILIHSVSGSFRISLYAEQSSDLDLESSVYPNRLNGTASNQGALVCLKR